MDQHKHSESPPTLDQPWRFRGKSEHDPLILPITAYGTLPISRSASSSSHSASVPLHPARRDHSPSLFGSVSADLIPFAEHVRGIFSFYRSNEVSDTQSVRSVLAVLRRSRADSH
jgi:hypothetical protein